MGMLGMLLVSSLAGAGCEKDTDCKGDRVCESGKCVAPAVPPPLPVAAPVDSPPPIVPAPPSMPPPEQNTRRVPLGGTAPTPQTRAVDRASEPQPSSVAPGPERVPLPSVAPPNAERCEEPLDADGRLKPECRVVSEPSPVKTRRSRKNSNAVEEEPVARAVGLIGIMYGAMFGGGAAVPAFAFTGSAGVRFRSGVGIVGVAHGRIVVGPGGSIQLYGLGPGVRFGNRTQLTLALTGTFAAINVANVQAAGGGLLSVLAQVAVVIGDHFTLLAQPTIDFDASGVIGSLTGGLGITF